jgi:hypothetical protein
MKFDGEICLARWIPDVTGTTILSAEFADVHLDAPDWTSLLKTALGYAFHAFTGSDREKLKQAERVISRTIIPGHARSEHFLYVETIRGSLLRENPPAALELAYRIAQELKCRLQVVLVLEQKTTRLWFDIHRLEAELLARADARSP